MACDLHCTVYRCVYLGVNRNSYQSMPLTEIQEKHYKREKYFKQLEGL